MTSSRACGRRDGGRGRETRRPTPRVFLAVDGESEKRYFEHYTRERSDVSLVIKVHREVGPKKIMDKCRKIAREYEFDRGRDVFAVVTDIDANTENDILEL